MNLAPHGHDDYHRGPAVQGDVREHVAALTSSAAEVIRLRRAREIERGATGSSSPNMRVDDDTSSCGLRVVEPLRARARAGPAGMARAPG